MLHGTIVMLRPVSRIDFATLETWNNDPSYHGPFNSFGLRRAGSFEVGFAENGLLGEQSGVLMIIAPDTTPVGTVSYRQVGYGPNIGSRAYNIGITIAPEHRGKGYGSDAQRCLADYLFATYPIMRVEATTDVTNLPEQRALEKAGFTREGVLRRAQWRAGAWHDLVLYSRLRGE